MKKWTFIYFIVFLTTVLEAQKNDLPYYEIPEPATTVTGGTVLSRLLDGLGYRYYWASEGLTEIDLNYKISEDSRKAEETIDHLFDLSTGIFKTISSIAIERGEKENLTFTEKREKTLWNIYNASQKVRKMTESELNELRIIFKRGERTSEFPLWNLINGQIADAIYHVGQIVTYRRASGNPLDAAVNVFIGKNRN